MRKKYNSILALLLALVLLATTALAAGTSANIDESKKGSVSITLLDDDTHKPVPGGTFRLYRVADLVREKGQLVYKATAAFEKYQDALTDLSADLAQRLERFVKNNADVPFYEETANRDGRVSFQNLTLGVYLVVQKGSVSGYKPISPFLLTIPMMREDGAGWIYDIDASPKTAPDSPGETPDDGKEDLTVEKKWSGDDSRQRPKSVTVELWNGNKRYDTVTLSDKNNWKHKWTDLPKGGDWEIREVKIPGGYEADYVYMYKGKHIYITVINTYEPGNPHKPPPETPDKPENPKPPMPGKPPLLHTGQLNWPVPVLAGIGVLLFTLGWYLTFAKRKRHETE